MTNSKNAHNRQMALIGSERWNWMGHQGTETEELDMLMLRPLKNAPGFSDYAHRQLTIAEIRERLYAIKSDLGLLSEEEIRAEEEARERRRAERAERLRREQEEAERRRLEEEERRAEEERRRIAAEEYARRWAELEAAGELTDEATRRRQTLLEGMARNQTEINNGAEGVTFGARALLVSLDAGYVSYLDGSVHTSVAKLEQYNANHIVATRFALRNTKVSLPNEGAFHTFDLNETIEARNLARKKLDAFRAIRDPTYASRLRSSEKDGSGRPTTAVTEEDGDEAALLGKVEESKDKAERVRKEYNKRAAASGERVQIASCSQVQEGQAQESAPVVADSSEKEEEAAAPVVEEAEPVAEQEQPEEEQKEQEEEEAPKTPGFDTAEY